MSNDRKKERRRRTKVGAKCEGPRTRRSTKSKGKEKRTKVVILDYIVKDKETIHKEEKGEQETKRVARRER